ncbi:hypothetical protein Hanom_Chr12g01149611 [Helianthus anomalus]
MAEQNPSLHVDGESSSFRLPTNTVHVQGYQRNGALREEPTINGIPNFFGSASRVINQTTPGVINQASTGVQMPNHGAGPSAPSVQAQLNISAILGLPKGETLAS